MLIGSGQPGAFDELVRRYVRGEIGGRTVLWARNWDHWDLIDACLARGLPPLQV